MRKFITLITLLLLCILLTGHAQAGLWDGAKLFEQLKKDNLNVDGYDATDGYDTNAGVGYIIGVFDANDGVLFCSLAEGSDASKQLTELGRKYLPNGGAVSIKQVKRIVFNYMHRHQEFWNVSAAQSVVNALKEAYPCK